MVCRSVGWFVSLSVGWSVRNAYVGGKRQDGERLLLCILTCYRSLGPWIHLFVCWSLSVEQVPRGYNDAPSSVDRQTKLHFDLPIDTNTCSLMVLYTLNAS